MKNVTPKAGQVWVNNETEMKSTLREDDLVFTQSSHFNKNYTFIPQNDLEWLAVNVDKWINVRGFDWISKAGGGYYFHHDNHSDRYTREQHQNMRYELGLDDRPKHNQGGPVDPKIMFKTLDGAELINQTDGTFICVKGAVSKGDLITQKETKMIDLSNAKVGDKFVLACGDTAELIDINKSKEEYLLKDNDGFHINDIYGRSLLAHSAGCNIVAKHDPRPWLKDLPDADLFTSSVTHICFNEEQGWLYTMNCGKTWHQINVIKMPTLTGDQWEDSKISIDELRACQRENK